STHPGIVFCRSNPLPQARGEFDGPHSPLRFREQHVGGLNNYAFGSSERWLLVIEFEAQPCEAGCRRQNRPTGQDVPRCDCPRKAAAVEPLVMRSEEHTSEL